MSNFIFMPNPIIEEPDDRLVVYDPTKQPRKKTFVDRVIEWWKTPKPSPPPLPPPKPIPALPAPPVTAGPLVIYRPPRYGTRKLTKYGNLYIGQVKLNKEAFEKFRGSGRVDPVLF